MQIEDIRELLRRYPVVAEVPLEQPEEFTRAGMVQVKFHGGREAGMALGLPLVRFLQGIVAGVGSSWLGVGIDAGLIGAVVGVGVGRGRHEPIVVTHP